jgi:hypothetical protein
MIKYLSSAMVFLFARQYYKAYFDKVKAEKKLLPKIK